MTKQTDLQAIAPTIKHIDAMHLAQLTAYALQLPGLFFCREYRQLDDQAIINECITRLVKLVSEQQLSIEKINALLQEKDYFDAEEAKLRVTPNPEE